MPVNVVLNNSFGFGDRHNATIAAKKIHRLRASRLLFDFFLYQVNLNS